jgi:hypothetical protein
VQSLRRDLGIAVQQDGFDFVDGMFRFRALSRLNNELASRTADAGALSYDVERCAISVGRKQSSRVAFGLSCRANLVGQADRRQGAFLTQPGIVRDRRPINGIAQRTGAFEGRLKIGPRFVVDRLSASVRK